MTESLNPPAAFEEIDSGHDPAQAARESAFSAPAFHWKDMPLHPFAIAREADWMAHCRRIGLPPVADAALDPELFLGHAIRLIWFCAHPPETWLAPRMNPMLHPFALESVIREWVDKHIRAADHIAAMNLAIAIYDRAHQNQPIAETSADSDAGKASGLCESPNTSTASRRPVPASSPSTASSTSSRRSAAGRTSTQKAHRTARSTNGRTTTSPRSPRTNRTCKRAAPAR